MGKGCGAGASLPLLSPPLVPYPWGRLLKKNKRIKKNSQMIWGMGWLVAVSYGIFNAK